MKTDLIQVAFTAGELSPKLLARIDLDQYARGAKKIQNGFVIPHGGVKRRPGTYYLGTIKTEAQVGRLIPFTYSKIQSYVLVFNGGKIQILKDEQFIESSPGVRYEVTIPYTESEIDDINYTQQGSILFICHPYYRPQQLVRITDTNWELTDIPFVYYALTGELFESEYVEFTIIAGTVAFDTTSKFTFTTNGSGTVTAGPTLTGAGNGTMTGLWVNGEEDVAGNWEVTCIYSQTNRQEWRVKRLVDTFEPIARWSYSNYPSAVTFFQQRLWLGGTPKHPQTFWGSKPGDDLTLTIGPQTDDAVKFTIAGDSFDQIGHMTPSKTLLILSFGGEYTATGNATTGINPDVINIERHTAYGSTNVRPARIGNDVLFIQRDRKKARRITFDVARDMYVAYDVSVMADHLLEEGVIDMTFSQDPDSVLLAVLSSGKLLSLTMLMEQNIIAWTQHTTGLQGQFESCCTIPTSNGDKSYFIINRMVNGVEHRFIEYLDYDTIVNTIAGSTLDCALYGTSVTPKTVWTGADHLEGETVSVVADDKTHPDVTVTGGSITLNTPASKILIGVNFETEVELLPPESEQIAPVQAKKMRVREVKLMFHNTVNSQVVFKNELGGVHRTEDVLFFRGGDLMDEPIAPFTGIKSIPGSGWITPFNISIKQATPMPWLLQGVMLKMSVNDGG